MQKVLAINDVFETPDEWRRGLQFVEDYPSNACALFVGDSPRILRFWGKNTLMPLDIAFVTERGEISSIDSIDPLDLTPVCSIEPCTCAIEAPSGALWGLEGGMRVEFGSGYARFSS